MINEQIVLDTIKRMLDSGIEEEVIVSTLKDIGLSDEEAAEAIAKVKTPQGAPAEKETTSQNDKIQEIKNHLEAQSESADLQDTTTYNMLNAHEQKIDAVSSKMDEMKQALSSVSSAPKDASSIVRLAQIETKLDEIDAQIKAIAEIMKSVLEVNRKVLVELESKK